MRLSRKVLVIVGFIVIGIVLGLMASSYFQTAAEHRALQDRLAVAETRVPTLAAEKADLENEERRALSTLETSRARLPQAVESIEYGDDLCRTARAHGLTVIELDTTATVERTVDGVTYLVSSYKVVVSGGAVNDILNYLDALRVPGDFQLPWSAQFTEVELDYEEVEATIELDIYGYKG